MYPQNERVAGKMPFGVLLKFVHVIGLPVQTQEWTVTSNNKHNSHTS